MFADALAISPITFRLIADVVKESARATARGMAQDVCRRACDNSDQLSIDPRHRNVYNRTDLMCFARMSHTKFHVNPSSQGREFE